MILFIEAMKLLEMVLLQGAADLLCNLQQCWRLQLYNCRNIELVYSTYSPRLPVLPHSPRLPCGLMADKMWGSGSVQASV